MHDEPSLEKMRACAKFLASHRHQVAEAGARCGRSCSTASSRASTETEHQLFVNEVVLRTQAQAEYAAENYGHFGLNLKRYAHFTSPIRRYADLIVHRALDYAR